MFELHLGLEYTIELLIKHGADVNVINNDGNSALNIATHNGNLFYNREFWLIFQKFDKLKFISNKKTIHFYRL